MKALLIRQRTHPSIPRRSPLERIAEEIEKHNPDLIVAPEYFMNNEKRIYTRQEKDELVQKIADISGDRLIVPGTALWQENGEMRNTVVAVTNGKVLAEHDKSVDGGESRIAEDYGVKDSYGKMEACVFQWKGLDIGLEICAEHLIGLQKKGGKMLDVQIVPTHSGWIREEKINVKDRRYAILCEGRWPRTSSVLRSRICHSEANISYPPYEPIKCENKTNVLIYNLFPEGR